MTCASDQMVIPVFVTRKWVVAHLGLSMKEVIRMDDEGQLKRSMVSGKPVKYHGWSVRKLMETTAN
jgi:hypothetical protein